MVLKIGKGISLGGTCSGILDIRVVNVLLVIYMYATVVLIRRSIDVIWSAMDRWSGRGKKRKEGRKSVVFPAVVLPCADGWHHVLLSSLPSLSFTTWRNRISWTNCSSRIAYSYSIPRQRILFLFIYICIYIYIECKFSVIISKIS